MSTLDSGRQAPHVLGAVRAPSLESAYGSKAAQQFSHVPSTRAASQASADSERRLPHAPETSADQATPAGPSADRPAQQQVAPASHAFANDGQFLLVSRTSIADLHARVLAGAATGELPPQPEAAEPDRRLSQVADKASAGVQDQKEWQHPLGSRVVRLATCAMTPPRLTLQNEAEPMICPSLPAGPQASSAAAAAFLYRFRPNLVIADPPPGPAPNGPVDDAYSTAGSTSCSTTTGSTAGSTADSTAGGTAGRTAGSAGAVEDAGDAAGGTACGTHRLQPYEEDAWGGVRIGGTVFEAVGRCPRCDMVCIDPDTGR